MPGRGRAHRQDAEPLGAGRQDEAQQDRGQPDHHHDQQARARSGRAAAAASRTAGRHPASRARTRPTQPRPNASRRPTAPQPRLHGVEPHRDQPLAEARGQAPVEPLDRDAEARNTAISSSADQTPCPAISSWSSAADPAPARAGTSGHGRERGQDVVAHRHHRHGHVRSQSGAAVAAGAGGAGLLHARRATARTSGSSISARSSSRTLSGGSLRRQPAPARRHGADGAGRASATANIASGRTHRRHRIEFPAHARASCAAAGVVYQRDR